MKAKEKFECMRVCLWTILVVVRMDGCAKATLVFAELWQYPFLSQVMCLWLLGDGTDFFDL